MQNIEAGNRTAAREQLEHLVELCKGVAGPDAERTVDATAWLLRVLLELGEQETALSHFPTMSDTLNPT
jgi:hypothetical protein